MRKIFIAFVVLIILIVLEATNVFGAGIKMNVILDNLIYNNNLERGNYSYEGEFSNANWFGLVEKNAQIYHIKPSLILAVIKEESNGFVWSVSSTGAIGLMQVEPKTATWIAQKKLSVINIFQPDINIQLGSKYLEWLIGNFRGNINLALAGYNAGQANAILYYNENSAVRQYVYNVIKYQIEYEKEGL